MWTRRPRLSPGTRHQERECDSTIPAPVDGEIKQAVLSVIDSRQYILGPQCRSFEAERADEILVPSHTAFPTIEAICCAEATPVFVDADRYYMFDPADAAAKATSLTVGLIPVHLYGQPVDLGAVRELARNLGVWLLEDCAQAHGAAWQGGRVGGFGRAGVLSFYPSKNLTVMGDGGAVVTSDDEIAARCRRLRDHGRLDKDVYVEIGFNLRFNEIQAAIGRVLLRRLDAMNDRRRALAGRYAGALAGLPLILPDERPGGHHGYRLYVVRTSRRNELAAFLKARDIQTGVHYPVPTHRQRAVEGFAGTPLPATEALVDEILTLPISASHTEAEIDTVAAVREFFHA